MGEFYVKDAKLIEGRDGWLYLAHDTNDVIAQHEGRLRLSRDQIADWVKLLETRTAMMEEIGSAYVFLIAPDTHAVYPEHLPPEVTPAQIRPVHQIMAGLREAGSRVRLVYPLEEMVAYKPTSLVCAPLDSHWTDIGAFVAYDRLARTIEELVPMRRLRADELRFYDYQRPGDLSFKLDPDWRPWHEGVYTERHGTLLHDNCVLGRGRLTVVTSEEAPPTTCLMFGDSYSNALLQYMGESFGRFICANSPQVDRELVMRLRPDVVVTLMAERFLHTVPDDELQPGFSELARIRIEQGRLGGRFNMWPCPVAEPEVVESIRASMLADDQLEDATIVSTLAYGGLRPGELLALRWNQIRDGTIALGKARSDRAVPLIDSLAQDLDVWRRSRRAARNGLVFPGRRGRRWTPDQWFAWSHDRYGPRVAAADVPYTAPRDLRFTLVELLLRAGRPWHEAVSLIGEGFGRPREEELWAAGSEEPLGLDEQVAAARARALGERGERAPAKPKPKAKPKPVSAGPRSPRRPPRARSRAQRRSA